MLWYGTYHPLTSPATTLKRKWNKQDIRRAPRRRFKNFPEKAIVRPPLMFDHIIFKNKFGLLLVYGWTSNYYFCAPVRAAQDDCYYNAQTGGVTFETQFGTYFYNLFWRFFRFALIFAWGPLFKKIKFKGKGYYVFRNFRNTLAFKFGYAHRYRVPAFDTHLKIMSKTSLMLFGTAPQDLEIRATNFRETRPFNLFTSKGVRFTRQVIYKKTGKVGSYR